ncbi:MAG TPA: glycosyltransferase [Thermoanaerobaculia bacterium]|nr:glycosyltransferase [Thermoanaerobaculia bacterium]
MTAAGVFLAALGLSVVLHAVAVAALRRHRRRARRSPFPDPAPMVSVVKPLCGLDAELEENVASFFRLDYPSFEIVFSFASAEDPAFCVARRIADRYPLVPTVFVVDGREPGRNAKVNRLAAALRRARGTLFLFSDGDVRVRPDFLRRVVPEMADPSVGLVSCLFRSIRAASLASRLESLYLDGILRPATAAIAGVLRMPCVVGKSILISRAALIAIGGMQPLRDHLAEDFLLGKLAEKAGYRAVLSSEEIRTVAGARTISAVWQRHRRWAILRKRLGGVSYLSELFSSPLPFVIGAAATSGGDPRIVAAVLGLGLARLGTEALALANGPERVGLGRLLVLLPFRDLGAAALFWAGLFGRRTRWRGRRLRVGKETLLRDEKEPTGKGRRAAALAAIPAR